MFNEIDEEDYCKPIKTKSAFNNKYTEYKTRGDKDENLSLEEYLEMIKPYLRDLINNHKEPKKFKNLTGKIIEDNTFGEWKIQLTMQISFISSLETGEIHVMNLKSKNVETLMGDKTDDIIKELFKSLKKVYQEGLQKKMKGSKFVFRDADLLYYSLHKTRLRRGKSYIDSPEWLGSKRATINSQNYDDNNCFQYAITVALNHQSTENHPEKISNIKPFINKYNWKDIPLNNKETIMWQLTGKSLNKIIRQLLLIYYLHHTIKKQ